ncbi:hypothetical protein TNCV_2159401 [Trichonephila clavipes]|nr:hypothetical protein TNCV_2159401 [Trichonephila clavipes]
MIKRDRDVQPFRKLLQILMLGHQQVSPSEPFNETSSIWAFGDEDLLSNGSRFQLNRADERVRVWRLPLESMEPTCQQWAVQAGGGSVTE